MTSADVYDAWFALVSRHLPLQRDRARVYVSPDAMRVCFDLIGDLRAATSVDPRLRGLEMRLERR